MAFELFLSKKLNKAEENDWLLNHNLNDGHENNEHDWQQPAAAGQTLVSANQNGYLVEREG